MYLSDIDDDDDDGDAEDHVDAADENETSNASINFKPQDLFGATPRMKAALGMKSKYNKLIDSGDEEEERRPTVKVKPKIPPKPRRREESSSSHAEEELPKDQAKPGTEFHYRELDDEYGSRPVAATSVSEKRKDHDVISIVSTSSQEYDAAARNIAVVPNPNKTSAEQAEEDGEEERVSPVPADPIIGHEHGVRPLLDDDELENAYGNQVHSKSVDMTDNPDTIDNAQSGTMSPDAGFIKGDDDDIFGAAPFRRKSKKKMSAPTLLSLPRPHHKDETKLKKVSPISLVSKTKDKGYTENQKKSDSQKHGGSQKLGDCHKHSGEASAELKTSLLSIKDDAGVENEYVNDMFGSVPFVRRPPSSVEVLPTTVSPSYDLAGGDKMDSNLPEKQVRNSYSADSLSQKSNRNPADMFGSVPFGSMQGQYAIQRRDTTASSRTETPPKATPDTSVIYRKSLGIEESDKSTERFNENVMFSSDYQRFEEDSDSEEVGFVSGDRTKFTKSKGSKSPEGQNIEDSAFSNMSFNDFDEDEDNLNESFDRLTVSQPERNSHNMKYSQSQILNIASVRQPAYVKESNNMVNSASGETVRCTPEKFDTFTWPRKRLKGHGLQRATAEPFTGKKKVDI